MLGQANSNHVERCLRCGRVLRDKVSIERGYGKRCWKKEHKNPDLIFLLRNGFVGFERRNGDVKY